jgi:L-2,4-diaminobutyrate decarboxylase
MDTNAQSIGTPSSPIARALAELDADALPEAAEPFIALVSQYLARTSRRELPVSRPSMESFERAAPVALPRRGRPLSEVVSDLARDVVMEAIHLSHPMYMGHQIGAPLPVAVWTEALVGALNQAMTVTEMPPTATRMEPRRCQTPRTAASCCELIWE